MEKRVEETNIVGIRIKEARERARLSQNQLQSKTGIAATTISQYEKGRRIPKADNLRILANALLVTVDYLVGRDSYKEDGLTPINPVFPELQEFLDNQCLFSDLVENPVTEKEIDWLRRIPRILNASGYYRVLSNVRIELLSKGLNQE